MNRYDEANTENHNALTLAKEIQNQTVLWNGKVLSAKINFHLITNEDLKIKKSIDVLKEMLEETEDHERQANLHKDLFQLIMKNEELRIDAEKHRQKALELYHKLYEKTPKVEFKQRIEELLNEEV